MFRATVRYGRLRHLAEFVPPEPQPIPAPRARCVVRTERGVELGVVLAAQPFDEIPGPAPNPAGLPVRGPGRSFLRVATAVDLARAEDLAKTEERARAFATERAEKRGLALRVVAVEPLFSGERLVVYYTAEDRLDLRELARDIQGEVQLKVELRQIGARERARACGGVGSCGRTLCCSTFLRTMEPVTLRMAKVQGFSLSPDATSGACGRLKCCLRYENPLYEEGRAALPRVGLHVEAARAAGEVVLVDVLARKVTVRTRDGWLVELFAAELAGARTVVPEPAPAPAPAPPKDSRWRTISQRIRFFGRKAPEEPNENAPPA